MDENEDIKDIRNLEKNSNFVILTLRIDNANDTKSMVSYYCNKKHIKQIEKIYNTFKENNDSEDLSILTDFFVDNGFLFKSDKTFPLIINIDLTEY
jgi:hypothetical protein